MCPCGSGKPYEHCCGVYHRGAPAPTPEALMRSRYTAFVRGDAAYLHRTHAPETRPARYELDPNIQYFALKVHSAVGNTVEFSAHYLVKNQPTAAIPGGIFAGLGEGIPGVQRELSRFRKVGDQWLYVDGTIKADAKTGGSP